MTKYVQEKVANMEHPVTAWALCGLIVALAFVYAYFVNLSIGNAVAAREAQDRATAIASRVSSLESQYIAAKASVTEADIPRLGLSAPSRSPIYIAASNREALSFNNR
jgi:hypothetical protein